MKKYLLPILLILVSLAVGAGCFYLYQKNSTISSQEATDKALSFINENLLQPGTEATFVSIEEENGLYKLIIGVEENEPEVFISKDGNLLFINPPIDLSTSVEKETNEQTGETPDVTQSEIPDVKLFVMSYCPYGLQAEKMYLPVYNLLKDKTDIAIYFVDYIMHEKKEIDENLRQYCVQRDQSDKYYDYLSCFVKAGDFESCLTQTGIDVTSMNECIATTDDQYGISASYNDQSTWLSGRYPQFNIHKELNDEYDVGGSPTVIINGSQVSVTPRSPENFKNIICQAFTNPPNECSQVLSSDAASVSFGEGTSNSGGGEICE
ncbi:hypothetical protein ACFLYY_01110 [Patescibacteria group bacterium]